MTDDSKRATSICKSGKNQRNDTTLMQNTQKKMSSINRREFLWTTAIAATGAELVGCATSGESENRMTAYGGFRMGLQSFSLRHFDLEGYLERMKTLDLRYAEMFSGHLKVSTNPAQLAALKKTFAKYAVTPLGYFVDDFGKTVESNREKFEFARGLGLEVLLGTPSKESFESLDRLVQEYGIRIAIHNHGPGSIYATIGDVARELEGRNQLIGACVDTGHFLRADQDPIKAIETFGERTYGVHLKEVDKDKKFKVLGQGALDTVGVLRALKKLKFKHCLALEYEEHPEDPMADITECLRVVREAAKQI
jgi:inosose dehydratase